MSDLSIDYRDGQMKTIIMYDPERVCTNDCREREEGEPFIAVEFRDATGLSIRAYLPEPLARNLYERLGRIFETRPSEVEVAKSL